MVRWQRRNHARPHPGPRPARTPLLAPLPGAGAGGQVPPAPPCVPPRPPVTKGRRAARSPLRATHPSGTVARALRRCLLHYGISVSVDAVDCGGIVFVCAYGPRPSGTAARTLSGVFPFLVGQSDPRAQAMFQIVRPAPRTVRDTKKCVGLIVLNWTVWRGKGNR